LLLKFTKVIQKMKKNIKLLPLLSMLSTALILITACNSASSEAKKVEVKTVAPVEKVAKVETANTSAESPKKVTPKAPPVESKFVAGKHYVEIFPEMQTDAPAGKVEVVEIMWLGCPHCYTLEPIMLEYKKNHPAFVDFKQVPAMMNPSWASDGKTYVLAEMLDPTGEKQLVTKIFQAIHELKRRLRSPDAVKRFFVQEGFSEEAITNAQNSMAFQTKVKRAQEISAASQAKSVPTVIINGKYRTSPYMAGSEERLMEIIGMLAKKERK